MTTQLAVRRKAPVEQVDAQLAPMMLLRDTLSVIGPRIIREHSSRIGDRQYVHVAGATLIAAMFGHHVREVGARRIDIDGVGAWEATVEIVRAADGMIVGGGSAICCDDEKMWASRPQYARRAMASTRAAGRALRLFFGHAFTMLGDNVATVTLEEMPEESK